MFWLCSQTLGTLACSCRRLATSLASITEVIAVSQHYNFLILPVMSADVYSILVRVRSIGAEEAFNEFVGQLERTAGTTNHTESLYTLKDCSPT